MNEEEDVRNGYDIPFIATDLVTHTISDIIRVTQPIFSKAVNENSPKWKGATFLHLYNHQRALISEMIKRERDLRNGLQIGEDTLYSHFAILGDKAASGKSWTTVAYIKACKDAGQIQTCNYLQQLSNRNIFSTRRIVQNRQTNLILVPSVLLQQWRTLLDEEEGLTYMCIRRNSQINDEQLVDNIQAVDVVLVPSTLFPALCDRLINEEFQWTRTFIDDWSAIPLTQVRATLKSQFTWLLTPNWFSFLFTNIYFNIWYMQSLLNSIPADAHPDMRIFFNELINRPLVDSPNSRSFFSQYINNHPNRDHLIVRCTEDFLRSSINLAEPRQTIIPYCGDTIMRFLYALCSRGLRPSISAENYMHAMELVGATIMNATEWAEKKDKFIRRSDVQMEACPICFEEIAIPTLTPCCQNFFCAKCLLQSCQAGGTNACPLCRGQISGQRLIVIADDPPPKPYMKKINCLARELKARPNGSHLIYFPCEPMYGLLRAELRAAELNFDVLTGTREIVKRKTERFIGGQIDILVIFSRHQILNVNLPNVSTIFIYPDNIDEIDKMRLIHRTQQIGRAEPLEIVRFSNAEATQDP